MHSNYRKLGQYEPVDQARDMIDLHEFAKGSRIFSLSSGAEIFRDLIRSEMAMGWDFPESQIKG